MNKNVNEVKIRTKLVETDHPRITLCPALEYKIYCQICGSCEYCPHYKAKEGDNCEGCGANFKNQDNPKAKYK